MKILVALMITIVPISASALELTSWWATAGEQSALHQLTSAYEQNGGQIEVVYSDTFAEHRNYFRSRVSSGQAPEVSQWILGPELFEMVDTGLIRALPDSLANHSINDIYYPQVIDAMSKDGQLWAIPVGIHVHNSAFYNRSIYESLSLELPKNWSEWLSQAKVIADAGHTPIAMSTNVWQQRYIVQSLVLDLGGIDAYRDFYSRKPAEQTRAVIDQVAKTYLEILSVSPPVVDAQWTEVVASVQQGKAAMLILGDYVQSEFMALGAQSGKDYICTLTPGQSTTLVYGIDAFIFAETNQTQKAKEQDALIEVMVQPDVKTKYIHYKGGLPPEVSISPSMADDCARQKLEIWNRSDVNLVLSGSGSIGIRTSAIDNAIHKFISSQSNADTFADELWSAMQMMQ